jgi:hypothetical protein
MLRFIWSEDGQVVHYRMNSHLFGGIWCASSATFALRQTAHDDTCHTEDIKGVIQNNFYVDDCLKSVEDRDQGDKVIKETKQLLSQGGFNLTKFITNDSELLKEIPESERAKEVKNLNHMSNSKALGIHWDIVSDSFYFEVEKFDASVVVTRRKMLSLISSMFDPLGLVSHLLITGRLLFQEATKLKLQWDQEVPLQLRNRWIQWVKDLSNLVEIKIPRCFKPKQFTDKCSVYELHHFSDASQRAYGSCTYIRCINDKGQISVCF